VRPPTPPPRSPKRLERQRDGQRASLLGDGHSSCGEGSQGSQRTRGSSFGSEPEELDLGSTHLLRKQAERERRQRAQEEEDERLGGYKKGEMSGLLRLREAMGTKANGTGMGKRASSGEVEIKPLRLSLKYPESRTSVKRKNAPVPILGIPTPGHGRGAIYDV
jgi:hypothetical protein